MFYTPTGLFVWNQWFWNGIKKPQGKCSLKLQQAKLIWICSFFWYIPVDLQVSKIQLRSFLWLLLDANSEGQGMLQKTEKHKQVTPISWGYSRQLAATATIWLTLEWASRAKTAVFGFNFQPCLKANIKNQCFYSKGSPAVGLGLVLNCGTGRFS